MGHGVGHHIDISIHALREEGDTAHRPPSSCPCHFYPCPPRGGRPALATLLLQDGAISIHALREEGDKQMGRAMYNMLLFLSTPSVRRATLRSATIHCLSIYFYPRPPRGGRPPLTMPQYEVWAISIHALREEGDPDESFAWHGRLRHFYPRPP